ncbi:ESX secretion-associated protein EspG [Saccharomonospora sp. NPDC006951]
MELSLHTLLAAMRWAGCGEPHLIFAGGNRYLPPAADDRLKREMLSELTGLGLADGTGLEPDFEHVLRIIDRPYTEYYAYLRAHEQHYGVLVAVQASSAVVASHHAEWVRLDIVADEDLPSVLVSRLPPVTPAEFTPFSVAAHDYPGYRLEARWLDRILTAPQFGMGHLHAARRTKNGNRTRAKRPVSYLDTEYGRVGIERDTSDYLTVFPGEPGRLASRLAAARSILD